MFPKGNKNDTNYLHAQVYRIKCIGGVTLLSILGFLRNSEEQHPATKPQPLNPQLNQTNSDNMLCSLPVPRLIMDNAGPLRWRLLIISLHPVGLHPSLIVFHDLYF